jgi:phage gpG-like protein
MTTFSLASFAAFSTGLIVVIDKAKEQALEKGAKIIEEEAKRVLGTDGYGWTPLSTHTVKTQPGMLLETGELHDSIEHQVVSKDLAYVGSNNDKAVWHEFGTKKIPPRSFLMGAAVAKTEEVGKAIGQHIVKMIKNA